jgi:hypothetical protein
MKTKPHHPAHPRQPHQHPHRRPTIDPLRRAAIERRLHTDFLALAFYPGMRKEPLRAESTAA